MKQMWIEFLLAWAIATLLWLLVPLAASAGVLDDTSIVVSHYTLPVSDTGGASAAVKLPFGTVPGTRYVLGGIVDRFYYTIGGRLTSAGPQGPQPSSGLVMLGLGTKLHELIGVSYGWSHHDNASKITDVTYFSIDVDWRLPGELMERLTRR